MPEYQYVAMGADGKKVKGTIAANNQTEFNEMLKAKGQYCLSVTEIEEQDEEAKSNKQLPTKELAVFFRQMATMLASGLTIVNSLEIIQREMNSKRTKIALASIYSHVQEGKGLGESMKMLGKTFPPFAVNMVMTGEMSGSLDNIVDKLATYYEKEMKTHSKVVNAMTYPIILAVLTVAIVIVLLGFVMPSLLETITSSGGDIPATTAVLIGISNFITKKWYILLIIVAAVVFLSKYLLSISSIRLKWDQFKFKIPVFGSLYLTIVSGNFARSLYALFSGGTSLIGSLEMAAKVVGNTYVEQMLLSAKDEISKGKELSVALKNLDFFPSMMVSLMAIGEQSGSLDSMILRTADIYEEESDNAITRLVSMLEPIMIIVMAVIVGFIIIAILMAIYGSYDSIS